MVSPLVTLVRQACPYLIEVCVEEWKLFQHFFLPEQTRIQQQLAMMDAAASSDTRSVFSEDSNSSMFSSASRFSHRTGASYYSSLTGGSAITMSSLHEHNIRTAASQRSDDLYSTLAGGMRVLLGSLCVLLYEALRSLVVHENDLDVLCDLVDILRNEVLLEGIRSRGDSASAFTPVVHRMIQDVQERLIYRSSIYIREEIKNFQPTPADLNYPDILLPPPSQDEPSPSAPVAVSTVTEPDAGETSATTVSVTPPRKPAVPPISISSSNNTTGSLAPPIRTMYSTWYPPLEKTLNFLSKLYRVVETGVFEGLAQAAVSVCTQSFLTASQKISEQKGVVDGQLFLIKHLLTLREQISPFDVSFCTTEKMLDFSHIREGLSRFLRGQSGFKLWNLIFDIMSSTKPRIFENHIDSRKDLEKQLKVICESFILNSTKMSFDPIIIFLKRIADQQAANTTAATSSNTPESECPQNLKIEEIKTIWEKVARCFDESLRPLDTKMTLYLANPVTQAILFRPIKATLLDTYQQFQRIVTSNLPPEEYLPLGMWTLDELALQLDTLAPAPPM